MGGGFPVILPVSLRTSPTAAGPFPGSLQASSRKPRPTRTPRLPARVTAAKPREPLPAPPAAQVGVASTRGPAPQGRRAGRAGRGEGTGKKGRAASRVGSLVLVRSRLACGRGLARARAEERPARAAERGSTRGAGASPARAVPDPAGCAGARAAHALRGRDGGLAEPAPGVRDQEESDLRRRRRCRARPGRRSRVGGPRAAGGRGGERRNFPAPPPAIPGPFAARGGVVAAGGGDRRHVGVCEKRGAPGRARSRLRRLGGPRGGSGRRRGARVRREVVGLQAGPRRGLRAAAHFCRKSLRALASVGTLECNLNGVFPVTGCIMAPQDFLGKKRWLIQYLWEAS